MKDKQLWVLTYAILFTRGYYLYFFLIIAHFGGFGCWIWFLGVGISVDGVWGSLYNHRRMTLGKTTLPQVHTTTYQITICLFE